MHAYPDKPDSLCNNSTKLPSSHTEEGIVELWQVPKLLMMSPQSAFPALSSKMMGLMGVGSTGVGLMGVGSTGVDLIGVGSSGVGLMGVGRQQPAV